MESPKNRKILVGTVISNKMDKTIVVRIERTVKHPTYGKYIHRTSRCYAHDPHNECKVGDVVRIVESRPLSHTKRWQLIEVVEQSHES